MCVCGYVPSEGSPFYPFFDIDNGVGLLEKCFTDFRLSLNNVSVIVSDDLNNRTASNSEVLL